MAVVNLRLTNFKSFESLDLELSSFNVLIGPNASGKSNVVQALLFLRDTLRLSLQDAISVQGGHEYLTNTRIGRDQPLALGVRVFDSYQPAFFNAPLTRHALALTVLAVDIGFSLGFTRRSVDVLQDSVTLHVFVRPLQSGGADSDISSQGQIFISNVAGNVSIQTQLPPTVPITADDFSKQSLAFNSIPQKTLLIQSIWKWYIFDSFSPAFIGNIAHYDLDPRLLKRSTPITGVSSLDEYGSNLALVLRYILDDPTSRQQFLNIIRDVLPFVEEVGVERFADRSLLLKVRERYFPSRYLPASLLSDGTLHMTALIAALYFQGGAIAIFEEPERGVHPQLISRLIDMFHEVASRKQVIITTHNPEVVRNVKLEELLLVKRDSSGFTKIDRPAQHETVRTFLQHELGVEDLFVEGLLDS